MSCGTCGIQASNTMQDDTGVPAGAPQTERPRCPFCKAFVTQDGAPCRNPRCPGLAAAPASSQQAAIAQLRLALHDPDRTVRPLAAQALAASLPADQAIPMLAEALRASTSASMQEALAGALGRPGWTAAIPPLGNLLRTPAEVPAYVRVIAIRSLGRIGGPETTAPLLTALDRDPSADVRTAAAEMLGQRAAAPSWAVRGKLASVVNTDPNRDVRCAASRSLAALGDTTAIPALLVALGNSGDDTEADTHLMALARLPADPAATTLMRELLATGSDRLRGSAAIALLSQQGDGTAQQVLGQLLATAEDHTVRYHVVRGLADMPCPPELAGPLLAQASLDGAYEVATLSTKTLGQVAGEQAVAHLGTLARSREDACAEAITALGRIRTPASLQVLQEAYRSQGPHLRELVAEALGAQGSPEAQAFLTTIVQTDTAPQVRQAAVTALGHFSPVDTGPVQGVVASKLRDADRAVRHAALTSLAQLGGPAAVRRLKTALTSTDTTMRRLAAQALGQLRDPTHIPALQGRVADDDPLVRAAALQALGTIGDPQAIPVLRAFLLAQRDSYHLYRSDVIDAVQSLGHIGTAEAVAQLDSLCQELQQNIPAHHATRQAIAITLQHAQRDAALPLLCRLLQDTYPPVRGEAVRSIGRLLTPPATT